MKRLSDHAPMITLWCYLAGVAITYGWAAHGDCDAKRQNGWQLCALPVAFLWPAYVPLHISYELWRPNNAH